MGCGDMDIVAIAAMAIVSTVLCVLLKQYKPEYALFASVVCITAIFLSLFTQINPIIAQIKTYISSTGVQSEYVEILIKALGISYIVEIAADISSDMGQKAIASKVELAGKFAILILCLPLLENLIDLVRRLIN